jgi:voltage-gated potassium channel
VIVIGYGRMGRPICQEFERQRIPFVVIDRDDFRLRNVHFEYGIPIQGDATLDETLRLAGVERARSLIVVLPSDSDNLYITLSARVLNENLHIIARAEGEGAEAKLKRVGANRIFAPYVLTGHRVVQSVLRPTVGQVIEKALHPGVEDYQIEELLVEPNSTLIGKKLREINLHDDYGIVVLIVKRPNGEIIYNPRGDIELQPDSVLVVVGDKYEVARLAHLLRTGRK